MLLGAFFPCILGEPSRNLVRIVALLQLVGHAVRIARLVTHLELTILDEIEPDLDLPGITRRGLAGRTPTFLDIRHHRGK